MVKTAIVYKTIYGSTKKYADWLSKDFKYKVFEMSKVKPKELKSYSHLIVMSGTYAGRMPLTKFLKKNWKDVKDKRITIVALGVAPQDSLWSKITYFFVPRKIKKKAKYFKIYGKPPESKLKLKKANLKPVIKYLKSK